MTNLERQAAMDIGKIDDRTPAAKSVWRKRLLLVGVAAMALGGCAPGPAGPSLAPGVNADYRAGALNIQEHPVPDLKEVINQVPSRAEDAKEDKEDKLRRSAMHDAAISYGARAGLAWETRNINRIIEAHAPETSRVYDFQKLLIKGPDHVMILPPVISEAKKAWEAQDAGKTLRVADTVYEIIDQARFTAVPPAWQSYLVRDYKAPEGIPDGLMPHDGAERDKWVAWVTEGWEAGRKQGQEIFKSDLERLERDFTGMVRYRALLEEGKVSPPVVADNRLGTTGTGQDMRVNDRAVKITRDPTLTVGQSQDWHASATTPTADGKDTTNPTASGNAPAPQNSQARSRLEDPKPKAATKSHSPKGAAWDKAASPPHPKPHPQPKADREAEPASPPVETF